MNRQMLKAQAKERIANAKPRPLRIGLFFTGVIILLAFFSYKLVFEQSFNVYMDYVSALDPQSMSVAEFMQSIDTEALSKDLLHAAPTGLATLLNYALILLFLIISAGMLIFCLNTLRSNGEATCWNLFDGFSISGRIILLGLLELLFISLWSMLFVIPGIIAFYRYRQAIYLLLDHPEKGPMQCIRESSRLMRGHGWELFVLDLSFILWFFLIYLGNSYGLAFGIPVVGLIWGVWFFPYYLLTCTAYYRELTGDDIPNNDGWVPEI